MNMPKKLRITLAAALALSALTMASCAAPVDVGSSPGAQGDLPETSVDQAAIDLLPTEIAEAGKVTFAGVAGMPPMMYVEQDGTTLSGVEHDILRSVGEALDLELTMVGTKPDAFLTGLLADRFQGAAGSITVTKERQAKVDFVAYAQYGQALMTRTEDAEILDLDTICGHPIGVLQGSVQQSVMLPELSKDCSDKGQEALIETAFPDGSALTLALSSGRIDGGLLNEVTLKDLTAKSNGELQISDTSEKFDKEMKGVALQQGTGLAQAVNKALEGMAENGSLEKVFTKWGISDAMIKPTMNPLPSER